MIIFALFLVTPPDPLEDLHRFPSAESVEVFYHQAYQEYGWLATFRYDRPRHQTEWWEEWLQESRRSYWAWDLLDTASRSSVNLHTRLYSLRKLEELLGERDYQAGIMPLPMQVGRYKRID